MHRAAPRGGLRREQAPQLIDAWVTALGLGRSPEVHHDTGRIHLGHCQECIPLGGEFLMTTEPDLREQFAPSGDALC